MVLPLELLLLLDLIEALKDLVVDGVEAARLVGEALVSAGAAVLLDVRAPVLAALLAVVPAPGRATVFVLRKEERSVGEIEREMSEKCEQ